MSVTVTFPDGQAESLIMGLATARILESRRSGENIEFEAEIVLACSARLPSEGDRNEQEVASMRTLLEAIKESK